MKPSPPPHNTLTSIFDGKYDLVKDIGHGGFGRVFLAKEKVSGRLVAIKQLLKTDDKEQKNIVREIQSIAKFNLPGVVTYYHHFWENGLLHLVMEYCERGSLLDVSKNSNIHPDTALLWVQILAETLSAVHERNVVHHDIKPANILFNENGTIKISDFGIANTLGGTTAYMAPELFSGSADSNDVRTDIYALGVTLAELLTGRNPFRNCNRNAIIAHHDKADFGLEDLPIWQQEVILKAIHKVQELRFQSMTDFIDALKSHHVPFVLSRKALEMGKLAQKAEKALATKKWHKVHHLLEYADQHFEAQVNLLKVSGKFYLLKNQIEKARTKYEQALKINPRLDVQKELGWLQLESDNFPAAISLLTDHLHRNPTDYEAYNLLLQCFIETERYETAYTLGKSLISVAPEIQCFKSNTYLAKILFKFGEEVSTKEFTKLKTNVFIDYNFSVVSEKKSFEEYTSPAVLRGKLLFHDFRYNALSKRNMSLRITDHRTGDELEFINTIIKFGRTDHANNHIEIPGKGASRRHCVIVNTADTVVLYDLYSTGTFVNGERANKKAQLIGLNTIKIAGFEFTVNTDKGKLL